MRLTLRSVAYAGVCLALAVVVQSLRLNQFVTGPAINAVLNTAGGVVGPVIGALVGIFTPATALLLGQLPAALAPAVPFIMIGNGLMVLSFAYLQRRNAILAVVVSAVIKYVALYLPVRFLLHLPPKIAVALGWPQLVTALVGGVVAVALIRVLKEAVVR